MPKLDIDVWLDVLSRTPPRVREAARRHATMRYRALEIQLGPATAHKTAADALATLSSPGPDEDPTALAPLAAAVELVTQRRDVGRWNR